MANFVGRSQDLEALLTGLEDCRRGHGSLVLISGEAGIGKTRLAEELSRRAAGHGVHALWGRCWDAGGAPAFWPWMEIVRACLSEVLRLTSADDLAQQHPSLAAWASDFHTWMRRSAYPTTSAVGRPQDSGSGDTGQRRLRLFDSVEQFLRTVAATTPMLLVLDDLHAADVDSLRLLHFLNTRVASSRILVVATVRDVGIRAGADVTHLLDTMAATSHSIQLCGFGTDDVAAFVGQRLCSAPDTTLRTLHEATGGNPFFLDEVLYLLESAKRQFPARDYPSEIPIPTSVRDLIRRRLELLTPPTLSFLALAAVAGTSFDSTTLRPLASRGTSGEDAGADPDDALAEATRAGLIRRMAGSATRHRFAHTLVRDVLYEGIALTERCQLHNRLGEILTAAHDADAAVHVSEIAHHFTQGAVVGDARRAIASCQRAGLVALAHFAYDDAALQFERGLDVLSTRALHVPQAEGESLRGTLLFQLGDAQRRCGSFARAKRTFRDCARLARAMTARGDEEGPPLLAQSALGCALTQSTVRELEDLSVVPQLEEALNLLPRTDTALRARVMARLAWALGSQENTQTRRMTLSRDAIGMAQRLGDQEALAWVLACKHWALWEPECIEERLSTAAELIRVATIGNDSEMTFVGYLARVVDCLELADIDAVDRATLSCVELATIIRQPRYSWYVARFQTMRALLEGRFSEAQGLAQTTFALGQRVDERHAGRLLAAQTVLLHLQQGRLSDIEGLIHIAVAENPSTPIWKCLLALLHVERAGFAAAQSVIEAIDRTGGCVVPRDILWLPTMALLAEACSELGDRSRARQLHGVLLPFSTRCVVIEYGVGFLGAVSHYLGRLCTTLGKPAEAMAYFTQAMETHAQMRATPWVARTRACMTLLAESDGTTRPVPKLAASATQSTFPIAAKQRCVLRQCGGYWIIGFESRTFSARSSLGLVYLAHLLRHPDTAFPAAQLVAILNPAKAAASTAFSAANVPDYELARVSVTKCIRAAIARLRQYDSAFAKYLGSVIKTGRSFIYAADTDRPVDWEL